MTVPQFADRIAPVPTTHNPVAFFVVSMIALVANLALVIYQWRRIIKNKINPLKDEVYIGTRMHDKIVEEYK